LRVVKDRVRWRGDRVPAHDSLESRVVPLPLTSAQKGAIAEAEIAAAAIRHGMTVLRPLNDGRRYDLVLDTGTQILRVQCKWAPRSGDVIVVRARTSRYTPTNGYIRTTYDAHEIDGVALYCPEVDGCFFIPIAEMAGRGYLHLRLAPARNHQQMGVTMAATYRLGAIAQLGERLHGMQEVAGSSPASSTSPEATRTGGLSS
jgi:hypothetical protein